MLPFVIPSIYRPQDATDTGGAEPLAAPLGSDGCHSTQGLFSVPMLSAEEVILDKITSVALK